MNVTLNRIFAASLALASLSVEAAGFQELRASDPGYRDMTVGIWYPSDQTIPAQPNTRFGRALALDAVVGRVNGALIVISHGFSGWYAGHAVTAEALADAGYIVAAPSHTGNTRSDMSSTIDQWLIDRPRHISRVIDDILVRDQFKNEINGSNIGVYGFSARGYTALSLIGGAPDLKEAKAHCARHPSEFICSEGGIEGMLAANMDQLPSSAWGADPRISAASIAAPAFGFTYTKATLANVTADVQLWSGGLDDSVPTETNAALIAQRLPKAPEMQLIEKAGHFSFLTVSCTEGFKNEAPVEYEMICIDAEGFDRNEFHESMARQVVQFFDASFGF